MLWFSLSFLTALASATEATFLKRQLGGLSPFEACLYPNAYALPLFLLLLPFCWDAPVADGYWGTIALLLPVNIAGILFYYRAINLAPVSLVLPYVAFTPAFALGTGYLILGETPTAWGVLGVLLIVAGCYILNIDTRREGGWTAPFRAAFSTPGSRAAIGAAVVFSIAAVVGKKGVVESDPVFFVATFASLQSVAVLILLPLTGRASLTSLRRHPREGMLFGGIFFLHLLVHSLAINVAQAAYMIAIKRLNAVLGVAMGGYFLKESNLRPRLAGATLMVLGAAVIGLLGN